MSFSAMKVDAYLEAATKQLADAGITTARLDCLVLLEDVLNTNRTQILAHPEREMTEVEVQKLNQMIEQRVQHVPLAYIRGKTEFYGREFTITDRVLEPRPESETMIDMLMTLTVENEKTIIDVGTGSGALAITAKLGLPDAEVVAIDIDTDCLQLAGINAKNLRAEVTYYHGDLLEALPVMLRGKPATLLCNLPYVPDSFRINPAAMHEPRLAIFGGKDGLDLYRRLFTQLQSLHPGETYVFCESLPPQHPELTHIATDNGFKLLRAQDFIQLFVRA